MLFNDYNFEDDTNTVYKDMITLVLLGIVTMFIIVLFHINPVGEKNNSEIKQPGNISVELLWPSESKMDIDLWVKAPGETQIGYSNKDGPTFNLVRDDVGVTNDPVQINYENAFSRGAPAGEYIVNVHLYNANVEPLPITVRVTVRIRRPDDPDGNETVLVKDVSLSYHKEEVTVFRFTLDDKAHIVPGSINDIPIRLFGAQIQ